MLALQLAAWCMPMAFAAAPAALVLTADTRAVVIDHGVELLLEEPGEQLTRDQIMDGGLEQRWKVYPGRKINLAREIRPVWIRFTLRNEAGPTVRWVLGINWSLLNSIDFHQFQRDRALWLDSYAAGLARTQSAALVKDPAPRFPLDINPGETVTVVLRVQTSAQFAVPLTVWDEDAYAGERYDHGVLMGLLFGVLGVMLVYNLSLYVFTRDSSFFWYSCYLLAIALYELAVTGYGPLYLWDASTWLKLNGYPFFASCSFLTASVFFRRFLRLGKEAPHLNRMNQVIILYWIVVTLVTVFPPTRLSGLLVTLGGMATTFAGLYSSVRLMIKGNTLAYYFTGAWLVIIIATFITLLALFGTIEGNAWVDNSQHLGFVVETVLLSIALAARIRRERTATVAAQQESQELARKVEQAREEKLQAQEQALEMQAQANEKLEQRVQDRTAELKQAMQHLEAANAELAKLSVTDALTQVHNRRYFDEVLGSELERSAQRGTALTLILCDIDHFKQVNDSVGHLAGDECLKLVAAAIARTVNRASDLVARYGGEEFAMVLPATQASQAAEIAESVRAAVEDIAFIYRDRYIPITISLGVVSRVVQPGQRMADFVGEADKALYAAKNAGRNRVQFA